MYKIDFLVPSCTCPDWINTNYLCKHFFAVFQVYPSWDWNTLPSSYLESPRLKLDSKAVESYFSHTVCTLESPSTPNLCKNQDLDVDDYSGKIPRRKVSSTYYRLITLHKIFLYTVCRVKPSIYKARTTLKAIESLTYTCTNPELLKSLNCDLECILHNF